MTTEEQKKAYCKLKAAEARVQSLYQSSQVRQTLTYDGLREDVDQCLQAVFDANDFDPESPSTLSLLLALDSFVSSQRASLAERLASSFCGIEED